MSDPETCREMQELAVWYPGGTLGDAERLELERHAGGCAECAGLLDFATRTAQLISTEAESHPHAEVLVRYADDPATLEPAERERARIHAAICHDCAEIIGILDGVERAAESESLTEPLTTLRTAEPPWTDRLRDWWEGWTEALVRPAPVLAAAAAALILAVWMQPGTHDEMPSVGTANRVGGVVLLPDRSVGLRGEAIRPGATTIVGDESRVLLLELTELTRPPDPDARYEVRLLAAATGRPVWHAGVRGAEFADTYTLYVMLRAGSIDPGDYRVIVVAPDGESIYRAPLTIR